MRTSPSIVPHGADEDTYLVLDDFGRIGCSRRETDAVALTARSDQTPANGRV